MTRLYLIILVSFVFSSCSTQNDPFDHSNEQAPGQELAGKFQLKPSYNDEQLTITAEGKVEYKTKTNLKVNGLAYKNQIRLIIFLDNEVDPTGIFLLADKSHNEWPGIWKGETRFLQSINE